MARVASSALIGLLTLCSAASVEALELSGALTACHDPSRIIEAGGRYYVFSTAPNINARSSADLVTWQWEPRVFNYASGMPAWMDAIAPGDNLWAPDVIERDSGGFLTFYSRNLDSAAGERSVCGVATSPDIDGPFTDAQAVLDVTLLTDYYRVIDPAPSYDESGQLWLAVGSFGAPNGNGYTNGGIRIFRLDAQTGKLVTAGDDGTRIAGSWIEAPFLYYHSGYYYLFFNEAVCCRGPDSTYFIRIGRSTSITGPYADMAGDSLLTPTSGGSLFMGLQFDANFTGSDTSATPRPNSGSVGRELGPGHAAISRLSDGIERLSYHFYDTATGNGEPTLGIKTVLWGVDGWPRPGWDLPDGTYAIATRLNAEPGGPGLWLDAQTGAPTLAPYTGADTQLWDITRISANRHVIAAHSSGQNVSENAGPITLQSPNSASASQVWFIEQTNDSSFRVLNPSAGTCLEVPDGVASAGVSVQTRSYGVGLPRQHWFITPAGAYRFQSKHGGLYATASAAAAGSSVVQQNVADGNTQLWWLVPTVDGYTKLINIESSLALTVGGGSAADGAAVVLETDTDSAAQYWSVDVLTDGSRRLVPKSSGQALGVADASTTAGAALVQQRWHHVLNQQWTLEWVSGVTGLPPISASGGGGGSSGASAGGTGADAGTAGVPSTGGSVNATGGSSAGTSSGSAGSSGMRGSAAEDSGCGCRVPAIPSAPHASWAALLVVCGAARRTCKPKHATAADPAPRRRARERFPYRVQWPSLPRPAP